MHVLRRLREPRPRQRLSQLRGRLRPEADPPFTELERRQLPWQGPGEHQGQAPAGRSSGARAVHGGDQGDPAGEAIAPPRSSPDADALEEGVTEDTVAFGRPPEAGDAARPTLGIDEPGRKRLVAHA